jgi:di/tricarboxylate transporter
MTSLRENRASLVCLVAGVLSVLVLPLYLAIDRLFQLQSSWFEPVIILMTLAMVTALSAGVYSLLNVIKLHRLGLAITLIGLLLGIVGLAVLLFLFWLLSHLQ